jgi:hypothetical protein
MIQEATILVLAFELAIQRLVIVLDPTQSVREYSLAGSNLPNIVEPTGPGVLEQSPRRTCPFEFEDSVNFESQSLAEQRFLERE